MARVVATFTTRTAALSEDFGLQFATRLFGAETIAQIPLITRGPRKGKPRGYLIWTKAEKGGWDRARGCVARPNELTHVRIAESAHAEAAMRAVWLGRMQALEVYSDTYLGEAGRQRWAAEQEQAKADFQAQLDAADARDKARAAAEGGAGG